MSTKYQIIDNNFQTTFRTLFIQNSCRDYLPSDIIIL